MKIEQGASVVHSPGRQSLRMGRVSLPNHFYHVTMVTEGREPVFEEFSTASAACRAFSIDSLSPHCTTLAFVVMPDHVHWLFQLHSQLSSVVKIYKVRVTMTIGRSIWADGYHDHALRQEEDIRKVARYIVANPLRAGLVTEIGQYPYWDAIWL